MTDAAEMVEPCYIARKRSCGCIISVVSDEEDCQAEARKALVKWAKCGYIIERIEAEAFRRGNFGCKCK
jgi:hypothetical protein